MTNLDGILKSRDIGDSDIPSCCEMKDEPAFK